MNSQAEVEKERALDQLAFARVTLATATQNHQRDPSRQNRIAVKAARRLLEEAEAMVAEWQ
jgi:hypothetical protein